MIVSIIASAGIGKRIGNKIPKQFIELKGIPILIHTLTKFDTHPEIEGIIISCIPEYIDFTWNLIKKFKIKKVLNIIEGGKTRQESVYNGVKASPSKTSIILVHDAVRPFISRNLITNIIETTKEFGASAPVIPVRDTLNKISNENFIIQHIERTDVYHIQTPQGAKIEILKTALEKAQNENLIFPDESSLLLYYGYKVKAVKGLFINFKITYPEDIFLAERLIDCKIENLLS